MEVPRSRYRLRDRLGAGGMAEVFRAEILGVEGFSRRVAIKRVLPAFSSDPAFAEMFKSEARIAALLHHPNIVSVIDLDRDAQGRLFLVMELIEGRDLKTLRAAGPLPPGAAAFIIAEVLRALAFAHDLEHQGEHITVVHRDVTPHNILIGWNGAVKLGDFGIAKAVTHTAVTGPSPVLGKAAYLSPEQARSEELDGRSDLFTTGIVLHELLTGRRLFMPPGGAHEAAIVHRVLELPIESPRAAVPRISTKLEDVCLRLLERDVRRRFQTAHAALDGLLACPELTARAQLELARLITARFFDEAPSNARNALEEATPTDLRTITQTAPLPAEPPHVDEPAEPKTPPRRSRPLLLPAAAAAMLLAFPLELALEEKRTLAAEPAVQEITVATTATVAPELPEITRAPKKPRPPASIADRLLRPKL